jgi:4-coumarate--CoA ligase
MKLSRDGILRIIRSLVYTELARSRGWDMTVPAAWDETTLIKRANRDETALGFDSLELLQVAGRVSQFFRLNELGIDDYLLRGDRLGDWVDLIADNRPEGSGFALRTSGTTGEQKEVLHSEEGLLTEVDALLELFPGIRRVVAFVPAHHIYGLLFTVLLPEQGSLDLGDAAYRWKRSAFDLKAGDLVVSQPERWRYLDTLLGSVPAGVQGVSSTSVLDAETWRSLLSRGFDTITEVYGSTETGGIGYRTSPDAPFTLLPHLERDTNGAITVGRSLEGESGDGGDHPLPLQDALRWHGERRFSLAGRKDGALQIGGHSVSPTEVARSLESCELVARASAWPWEGRIGATVVPTDLTMAEADVRERVLEWAQTHLPSHARPVRVSVSPES